jgi:hypothetical protein
MMGCNGTSGKNDTSTEAAIATTITLTLTDASGSSTVSFDKQSILTVTAHVSDQQGLAFSQGTVVFSSTIGELPITSKLTDANGDAVVTLTNDTLFVGAGTITATIGEVSQSIDFEFVDNDIGTQKPLISAQLLLNNQPVNQFKADQTAQISVQLIDRQNQPLVGKIIQFSADLGSLAADSVLTDSNGKAVVSITGADTIGAGVITVSYVEGDNIIASTQFNLQILAADAVVNNDEISIGYFDESEQFVAGKILLSVPDNTISAGGTLGLSVDLIDSLGNRITEPTPVNFTSNCVASQHAVIDSTVFSVNGRATATFEDIDCAGTTGTDDVLIATVVTNEVTKTASEVISIQGEQLGSIEFVSASPSNIVLKGTGGQGKQETSTLTFKVKSSLGNAVAQQPVEFSLNTNVGGITLTPSSALTNSQGLVSTQVASGTVPTSVRVNAKASLMVNNETVTVQSQSDLLSINTGLPEQGSMTLAASVVNPEAGDISGTESVITVWLADNFNNPVPDGTAVSFTAEGGMIEPSCITQDGRCSVTWVSAEPRVDDHRITILATALGHERFFDTNGNNTFDDNDGMAIIDRTVSSGFNRISALPSGFVDLTEAWRDDNENNQFDLGEQFLDYNNNGVFDIENGVFNGPQCQGALCANANANLIHVRKALVMVMSSSDALLSITDNNDTVVASNELPATGIPDIADGDSIALQLSFADTAHQVLPKDSQVTISLNKGELAGTTNVVVSNTTNISAQLANFVITNPVGGDAEVATLTVTVITPSGTTTRLVSTVNLL